MRVCTLAVVALFLLVSSRFRGIISLTVSSVAPIPLTVLGRRTSIVLFTLSMLSQEAFVVSTPLSLLLSFPSAPSIADFITLPLPPCRAFATKCGVGEALFGAVLLTFALPPTLLQSLPQLKWRKSSLRPRVGSEDEASIMKLFIWLSLSLPLWLTHLVVQFLQSLMHLQAFPFSKILSVQTFALSAP